MNTANLAIITEIIEAATQLDAPVPITGVEIRARYNTTHPESGDTIRSTTLTIHMGGPCSAYLTRRETPNHVSWITQDGSGYTEAQYALQHAIRDALNSYHARIDATL